MKDNRRDNKPRYRYNNRDNYSDQPRGLALPSPALLESYDEISPGLANKLADIIKQEQKHRHDWENKYLRAMSNIAKVGQLFGLVLAVIIIYATILLAGEENNTYIAAVTCFSGFAFLSCAVLASIKTKQHMRRPHHTKQYKR